MKAEFTPQALRDIDDIVDYIADDNPRRADRFADELEEKCETIALDPRLYRLRAEIAEDLRMVTYGDYLIFYREIKGGIRIERILHGMRDYSSLF